ncbi:MAG: SoxR reducing system RseC family protein [Candidatus Auribacterota bacterium]|nr:SoxR reducing system RseC family protein [Candidatus Auribacterota bacterium]
MIKRGTGTVSSITQNGVIVKIDASLECAQCSMCSGSKTEGELVCLPYTGLKKGDKVRVEINTFRRFAATFFTFFLPTLLLIVFLVAGENVTAGSAGERNGFIMVGFLLLGLAAGVLSLIFGNKFILKKKQFIPKITGKVDMEEKIIY